MKIFIIVPRKLKFFLRVLLGILKLNPFLKKTGNLI